MQAIFIQHDQALYVAKPIFSLVLCFVCDADANLGLIRTKVSFLSYLILKLTQVDGMSAHLERSLADLRKHLQAPIEEIADEWS